MGADAVGNGVVVALGWGRDSKVLGVDHVGQTEDAGSGHLARSFVAGFGSCESAEVDGADLLRLHLGEIGLGIEEDVGALLNLARSKINGTVLRAGRVGPGEVLLISLKAQVADEV